MDRDIVRPDLLPDHRRRACIRDDGGDAGRAYGSNLYPFDAQTGATLWGPLAIGGTYYWSNLTYDNGKLFLVNYNGLLTAYDPATGTSEWSLQLPGQWAFSSPPTASNGIVYVGGAGDGGSLYAVDETSGTLLWTAGVANGDNSSPAVGPNGVYVSYACPNVYAFDLTSSTTSGVFQWHYPNPSGCDGGGGKTPVYANGKLYVREPGASAVILNTSDGSLAGTFAYGPAPAIGSTTGFFLNTSSLIGSPGTLSATDLATNTVLWNFVGDSGLDTAPIVVDDTVIEGSSAGTLYGLNTQTGHVTWQVATGAGIEGPDEQNVSQPLTGLALADGVLVVPAGSTLLAYKIFGPPAPTGTTATGRAGAVDLSWSAAAGAATYNIYMGGSAGAEDVVPVQTGVTGTSTRVTNLTPGTTYFFTVKALGAAGISAPSNEASAAPHNPATPTALAATPVIGGMTLSWTASSEAISYNVYMGTSAGGESTTAVMSVTTPGATLTGLTPGVTYYFNVKAVSYGATSSPSNEASAIPAPAPPPGGVIATAQIGGVTLSWSAAAGATSYNVYSGTTAGGEGSSAVASGISGTGLSINGLTPGTTYFFVIRSVVNAVPGAASREVSATVLPTPAPAGVTGAAGPGQATLRWTASATATSYNVYSCSGTTTLAGLSSTVATVTGLAVGAQYCFLVKAQGPAGLSAASNQVTVTPTPYAGPTNVVAVAAIGQVTLTWTASPAATQYSVYMGSGAGLEGAVPVMTTVATSGVVSGLMNSSLYYFIVVASTPIGPSLPANEVSAAPLTPPPPTNLNAIPGAGQIELAWSASAGATSYQVYMGAAAGGESSTPVQIGITGLSTIVTGLTNGTAYYYIVRAVTPNGLSSASNEASAMPTQPAAPPAPANLTVAAGTHQVTLSWTASSGAAGYDIYMGTSSGGEASTPVMTGVTGGTATISGLTNGTTYYYAVKAVDADGSSTASNEVSATPTATPTVTPTAVSTPAASAQHSGGGALDLISLLLLTAVAATSSRFRGAMGGSRPVLRQTP